MTELVQTDEFSHLFKSDHKLISINILDLTPIGIECETNFMRMLHSAHLKEISPLEFLSPN